MAEASVQHELLIFCVSIGFGALCGVVFDLFRSFRKQIASTGGFVALQDILFWILLSGMFFALIYTYNYGQPRFYIFLGVGVGIVLYMLTLSRLFMKVFTLIIGVTGKAAVLFWGILFFPIKIIAGFLGKIHRKIGILLVKTKKILKNTKKQLKMY